MQSVLFSLEKNKEDFRKTLLVILDKQMNNKIVKQLMTAIFRGEDKRKERLACIKDTLSTECSLPEDPEDLVLLMCSFLPEDDDDDRTKIIKNAKKYDESQQRQLRMYSDLVAQDL